MASGQIDLSGVFFLDQSKLAAATANSTNTPVMQTQLADLQKQLQNAYSSLSAVNNSSSQFLSNQNDIAQIINSENAEINNKLSYVNDNVTTKKRVLELNESTRLRTAAYTSLLLILIFGLASFAFIAVLSKTFTVVPSPVYDLMIIAVICYCGFTAYYKYTEIINRDNLNFNEINQPSPDILSHAQIAKQRAGAGLHGDLLGSLNLKQCLGETCCAEGTVWDQMGGMCVLPEDLTPTDGAPVGVTSTSVPVTPSSIATTSSTMKVTSASTPVTTATKQAFSIMQEGFAIQPNSPNEFAEYSKI
jgi:hypothetical protein